MIYPCALKYWKERKEIYVGYLDGIISVFNIRSNPVELSFAGSFKMHTEAVHSIHVLNDLKFAISSGFDSTLKVWQPPDQWEKQIVVTTSMLKTVDTKYNEDNLSTIREEAESLEPETLLNKRRFSSTGAHDKAESLLALIK